MSETEQRVRGILEETIALTADISELLPDDDLMSFGMDSLNCIELIIQLEDGFHIRVPDDRLGSESVDTIQKICYLVLELQGKELINGR